MATASKKTNLMQASNQWAFRPSDERFWGLDDLLIHVEDVRARSMQSSVKIEKVKVTAHERPGLDTPELGLSRSNGRVFDLTHWSFGQLCRSAGAPSDYLRKLPAKLAAECINTGLKDYRNNEVQLLLRRDDATGNEATLRALTTEQYSRLWDMDVVRELRPATENGWMVPPGRPAPGQDNDPRVRKATKADIVPNQAEFGLNIKVGDLIGPAGVYHSDRDMFIFMVNPNRVIDINGDSLMRGFFLENSEVGKNAFKITMFYLESVCGNHICWGASGMQSVRVVHKGKNFDNFEKFGNKLAQNLRQLSNSNTTAERQMVEAARSHVIGKDKEQVVEIMYGNRVVGLTKATIEDAYDTAVRFEHTAHAAPNTTWGFVHGLTRYSQTTQYADERNRLDIAAGKLLQAAYKAKEDLLPVRSFGRN